MSALTVTNTSDQGRTTVHIAGGIDISTSAEFWSHMVAVLDQSDDHVVLDFGGTTFIDSTGINMVVRTYQALQTTGRELVLRCPGHLPRRVFEISGLDRIMSIEG